MSFGEGGGEGMLTSQLEEGTADQKLFILKQKHRMRHSSVSLWAWTVENLAKSWPPAV